jgi:hypothetical protein
LVALDRLRASSATDSSRLGVSFGTQTTPVVRGARKKAVDVLKGTKTSKSSNSPSCLFKPLKTPAEKAI